MKRESILSMLCLGAVLAFGALLLVVGLSVADTSASSAGTACQAPASCAQAARHDWMRSDYARRFAGVFKE